MLKKLTIIISLLSLCCTMISASDMQQLRFRHYTISEGLTSNTVRAIIQDFQGFIWFGTDDGLCRFDGIMIRRYAPQTHPHGMAVMCMLDGEKEIMVGSYDGLYFFDRERETFTLATIATSKGVKIKSGVTSIVKDADGCIWLSTLEQGVFRYIPEKKQLTQFAVGNTANISRLLVDRNNQVWAAANSLWVFNKAKNMFAPYNPSPNTQHPSPITPSLSGFALYEDSNGTLWLGSWDNGLIKVKTSNTQHPTPNTQLPLRMPNLNLNHIHCVSGYAPHQLLISSDDGLVVYDTEQENIVQRIDDNTGLFSSANRFIYTVIRDHEGGLWTGSFYGGVTYISASTKGFASFKSNDDANSISGNIINRFCEDDKGRIWIASDDGGLNCYNPQTNTFVKYNHANSQLSYDNVHALCVDGSNIWIGTYTGGINVYNTDNGTWRKYAPVGDPITSCYSLFRDSQGNIWAGTMEGISMLTKQTDKFVSMKRTDMLVIDIDEDADGLLWFSTQGGGIYTYNTHTKKWSHYTNKSTNGALPDDQVNCIHIAADGQMWIGTQNGLCRYDAHRKQILHVPLDNNGSKDNVSLNICGIIDDEHGLWLTTDNGLVRYVDGKCQNVFTSSDGLVGNQFMSNAILKASDGRIYAGCTNGFSAFYPYQIHTNETAPQVFITGLDIFNKNVPFSSDMIEHEDGTTTINLSYRDAVFSILFAALSYVNPEKNLYAYRLDGFDKEWQHVGSHNRATYTNLSPGTYTFRVKATNNDGLWSTQECSIRIVIHPPFYLSWPAKILYFVIFVALVFLALRYYRYKVEQRHKNEIDRIKSDKEEEMRNAKLQFFTVIAHEIRTPVSLIIAPLEKIMSAINHDDNTPSATPHSPSLSSFSHDLNMIDRNAHRLLELVNQLLDFRKVEQQKLVMNFQVQNLRQLILKVADRFRPTITQHAQFVTDLPDEHFTAILDPEAITKVISNLLTNADKYTRDIIRLSCQVSPDDEHVLIVVSDNGVGIRTRDRERIFTPFFQAAGNKPGTGIGLSIVKNIVDLHHGTIQLQSVEGQGSTFTIILPVKQNITSTSNTQHHSQLSTLSSQLSTLSSKLSTLSSPPSALSSPLDTVLLVDDNEDMLSFLMDNFKEKYIILTAHDGIEALDILKVSNVQLIVSDWMMPRMDGAEFCRCVRQDAKTSHIPFILLTAKTDDQAKTEGMNCGADAYIEKPFSMKYLDACLKNLLDLRDMLRRKFANEPLTPINTIAANPTDDAFLQKMNKLIEDNFSNADLNVDFLAEELGISRSGLYSKIKQMSGATPNEVIQTIRLKRAAVLLREQKYRISEICYMVGFSSPSYFTKCFVKQFGIKPADFAKGIS